MFVGTVLMRVASSKSVEAGIGTGPALDDIRLTALAVGKSARARNARRNGVYCGWSELRRGISWVACRIAQTDKMNLMPPHLPSSATRPKMRPVPAMGQADRVLES